MARPADARARPIGGVELAGQPIPAINDRWEKPGGPQLALLQQELPLQADW
jgi:hypothetical protein